MAKSRRCLRSRYDRRATVRLVCVACVASKSATAFSPTSSRLAARERFESRSPIAAGPIGEGEIPNWNIGTREQLRRKDKEKRVNSDISADDDVCDLRPEHKARERRPPFPSAAYPLAEKEEQESNFNYLSFVDQSVLKTYSQQTRLMEPRRYALSDQFLSANAERPPTIDDLAMPATQYGPIAIFFAWNDLPARAVVGSSSYLAFPYIIHVLQEATAAVDPIEVSQLVEFFLPGVAIVLGTYFSLTISILYERLTALEKAVNEESSVLALTLINLLHLFEESDPEAAVEGAQCIADQVRTLVMDSRGREAVQVMYNDPYARLLRLLKDVNDRDSCQDAYLLGDLHGGVARLYQLRSDRMTVESRALAPTHFDVMTFLSGLLLVGFALGTVATAPDGVPRETARVLFASLVVCYTVFYEMAFDLNRPFDGVYQIRRTTAAMHFLQIKQAVANHPVLKGRVDFEAIVDDESTMTDDCDGACQQRRSQIWHN